MKKDKDNIVLHGKTLRAITKLPPENCLEMMKAITAFVNKEEFTFSNPALEAWFSELLETFKRNSEQYEETCEKNAKNIQKRWNRGKSVQSTQCEENGADEYESIQPYSSEYESIPSNTKDTDNDNDHDTDQEKEKTKKEKESGGRPPRRDIFSFLPQSFAESEDFVRAWDDWLAYRRERKLGKWVEATLKSKAKEFADWGLEATIANIAYSIGNGYQGIFAPKSPPSQPKSAGANLDELKRAYKHKVNFYDAMFSPAEYELKALKAEDIESFKRYLGAEFYGLEELARELKAKKGRK